MASANASSETRPSRNQAIRQGKTRSRHNLCIGCTRNAFRCNRFRMHLLVIGFRRYRKRPAVGLTLFSCHEAAAVHVLDHRLPAPCSRLHPCQLLVLA
eukprot:3047881-Rhodomonas_salina.6